MKIRLYTESFKPYLSGVTVSVDTFAKGLVSFGHEVTVCAPNYPGFIDAESYFVFRFPSVGAPAYPGFRLALPWSLQHARLPKPDIIHSHSPYQLGYFSQWHARRNKIKFVYHFHTLFTEYLHFVPLPRWISAPIVRGIVRQFCRGCDLVIVPTPIVKNVLQQEYKVTQRIEILPTGVDDEAVQKASAVGIREKYAIPQDAVLLQYCGRLSKEKNIEFLLTMFAKVLEQCPDTYFMIVAFGPLEKELKAMATALKLDARVIFTGRVERAQIYNYMKAADLFVCASKTETQGLVISEAKACGKPAVAINAKGVSQMLIDGFDGFLVSDDIAVFVEKVVLLINDRQLRAQLSQHAVTEAASKYLNSAITKRLVALYNSL